MFLEDIDFNKPIPQPQLFLCKNNLERTTIANLSEAYNIELNIKFGNISELNFSVPFEIDLNNELIKNVNVNKLLYKYIIKIKLDSYEDYFIIDKPKDNMTDSDDVKNTTCYSIAYELKDKNIRNYVVTSKSINQIFNGFTDENGVIYSSILSETNWSLGYVDVDAQILYRGFNISSKTLLDFLFEIADTFSCIIIFDNKNKIINFYDPLKLGTYKGLNFSYGRYLQNMDYEPDYENVCTRLKLFGKDEITINKYNPTGTNYLESYSLFLFPFERDEENNVLKSSLYFSDSLSNSILDYQELISSKDTEFTTLIESKEVKQEELIILENDLNDLQTELNIIQDNFDIVQSNGEDTSDLLIQKQNKETEISNKQIEIDNKELEISNIDIQILNLKSILSMDSNFSPSQIIELNNYVIVKELTDESITNAKDLIEFGKKEFIKIMTPILNIKISTANLLSLLEEQDKWDKFLPTNLGDVVKIYYDKMNIEVEAKIIEFNFNFEEQECSLTISNSKEISDDKQKFIADLNKAISTSTTVDMNKYNISGIPQLTSEINQIINNKWDANKNAIIAGTNENYTLDRFGLTLKSPTDQLNFLRALHNVLAFTNDGGNTYKNALTPEGLVAEVVQGKLLMGVNLQIDASDSLGNKTFIVDQNGVQIFNMIMSLMRSDKKTQILLDPTNGIKIQKNTGTIDTPAWEDLFYINNDGNLVTKGYVEINSGTAGETHIDENGLYLGASTFLNAEFRVTPGGFLHAEDAEVTGDIDCNTLRIQGIDILSELNTKINGYYLSDNSVSADKISVNTLSAITANLGTVTAGSLTTDTTIDVGTDCSVGNQLILNPLDFNSGVTWGSTGDGMFYTPNANAIYLTALGGVYSGVNRLDQPLVAKLG